MDLRPNISVLMTAYNREKFIADAIESVLSSTYTNFELVIVDDGSTDNTVAIAKEYSGKDNRVKIFVNETNLGDYPNRNKAAFYAKGQYLKYLDSDDIIYPHCLQVMVDCMTSFPEAGLGLSAIGDEFNPYPICLTPKEAYQEFYSGKGLFGRAPGSSIILKRAFDSIGGFSGIRQVGDFEFWLKMSCYFPVVKMPLDLYWSRLHDQTEKNAHTESEKNKMRLQVINKIFKEENVPLSESEKKQILESFKNGIFKRFLGRIRKR